jgi:hypothetical protein
MRLPSRLGLAAGCAALAAVTFSLRADEPLPVIRPAQKSPPAATSSGGAKQKPDAKPQEQTEEHWQVVLLGDERIGYVRSRTEPMPAAAGQPARLRTDTDTKMTFTRFGQKLSMGVAIGTTETADGRLLTYEFEMSNTPAGSIKSTGTVKGDKLVIDTTVAGVTQSKTLPWDESVKSPAYQERLLREEGIKPGETKTFKAFVPEFNQVSDIRIAAEDYREAKLPDGTKRRLLKTKITQSVLPTMPMTAWLDDKGELVLVESDLLGQSMRFFEVSKDEALKEIAGTELDLAANTLISVTPLDDPHATKKIVYRIHVPGEEAAPIFFDGETQSVKKIDRETVEVTVTAKPVPRTGGRVKAPAEYTGPTQLVQSEDPKIREHLRRAVSPDRNEGESALALEKYVHDKLTKKNFSTAFASAAEVAASLEGDCTEHAVLLVALLRARGIPSKVAVGLVYVPGQGKMGGHMWTEALLGGEWVPLDATLGRGGIGAAHLKVGESSLADDAPIPVAAFAPIMSLGPDTRIEILKVER